MNLIDFSRTFSASDGPHGVRVLDTFASDGPCMFGLASFAVGSRDGFWERHDGGDEVLVILRGRAQFTSPRPDGSVETLDVGPGQAVFIPRGADHTGRVLEDAQVVFITPREGTTVWQEKP